MNCLVSWFWHYEAGEWVVPLIQAGSWLEGAHLVSNAIKTESKFDSADKLSSSLPLW